MPNSEEQEHWRAFQSGNKDALASLYNTYVRTLFNYGYKFTRDETLIEDCIQDLFVRIWDTRANLSVPVSVKHYLLKAFRSVLFRKMEQQSRRQYDALDEEYSFEAELSRESKFITDETQLLAYKKLQQALSQLPPRQKEALFLRYYEDASYEDIAKIMQTSVNATYKAVCKALGKLKEFYIPALLCMLYGYKHLSTFLHLLSVSR